MTSFVNNDVASGNIIYAADHNEQGALLASVLNGNIDATNIADSSVTTQKIANSAVTDSKLADSSVTPAKRSGGFKVGTIPGSTFSSTGNKAITGVGFMPKMVRFEMIPSTSTAASQSGSGAMTSSGQYYRWNYVDASTRGRLGGTDSCIAWPVSAGSSGMKSAYVSMDADGFTLNCTVASSAFDIAYEAYA